MLVDHLLKTKKESKNLKKQETQGIFTKMKLIWLAFNTIWLIIRNFKKRAVYSGSKDDIWGADLADMQLICKFNKGFRFLLCVIDIFSKYALVVPLKNKKGV